jgi:hypothetical protein
MSQPTTTNISDTITVVSELVDAYNDAEQYGPEVGWIIFGHISKGIDAIQAINPTFFTSEELGWIQELLTQIEQIETMQEEGDSDES